MQCLISDHTGVARGKMLPVDKFISEQGCRLAETQQESQTIILLLSLSAYVLSVCQQKQ